MYGFLEKRIVEARAKAKVMGTEAAVELADNTLDMMVARELKGEDWMPDNEMKDELFLCESALLVRQYRQVRSPRRHGDLGHDSILGESRYDMIVDLCSGSST
jgi:hypothetical protein